MDPSALNQSTSGLEESGYLSKGNKNAKRTHEPRRRTSSIRFGRFLAVVTFLLLAGTHLAGGYFLATHPRYDDRAYDKVMAYLFIAPIWISALSIGILCRQRWAKHLLSAFAIMSTIAAICALGAAIVTVPPATIKLKASAALFGIIQVTCAAILAGSKDVKRLTTNY